MSTETGTRVHDMTSSYWGHAVLSLDEKADDGTRRACIITSPRIHTDDEVLLPAANGKGALVYKVVGAVRTPMDPGDQHFLTLRWTGEGIANGSTERTS